MQLYDWHVAEYGIHPRYITMTPEEFIEYISFEISPPLRDYYLNYGFATTTINKKKYQCAMFRGVPVIYK